MRFTKSEVLDEFARQDRSYRLAIMSSHWLQGGAHYKPSAAEEARGLHMKVLDTWVSYFDLAELLEQDPFSITTDFVLNQLHSLVRVPFELLGDYCEDYDQAAPGRIMMKELRAADWYEYTHCMHKGLQVLGVITGDSEVLPVCGQISKHLKLLAPIVQALVDDILVLEGFDCQCQASSVL
jgi:hypothetical protein